MMSIFRYAQTKRLHQTIVTSILIDLRGWIFELCSIIHFNAYIIEIINSITNSGIKGMQVNVHVGASHAHLCQCG